LSILFGGCSGRLALNTLKCTAILLAEELQVHERMIILIGASWLYTLEGNTIPGEYLPPVADKTAGGCARTWKRINISQNRVFVRPHLSPDEEALTIQSDGLAPVGLIEDRYT
jgi:hypothetical protein